MQTFLVTERLSLQTRGNAQMLDITEKVAAQVHQHRLHEGHVLLFVPGATGALTTIEYEPGLIRDFPEFFGWKWHEFPAL